MSRQSFGLVTAALLVSLPQVILGLKDVVLDIEPRVVQLGEDSTLRCSYDLEDLPLYCVKWYRGQHEFYRYTPKEHPSTKIFAVPGLHVDLKQSNEHQVVLREVGFNLSGKFTCEVTTDAPLFTTNAVSKDMLVVVLPSHPPTLSTDKGFYDVGDVLRANCSSPPSRPGPMLTFYLNDIVVCDKCITRKHAAQELWWSDLSLEFPLFPSNFKNGRLNLKCVAQIGDLYQKEVDINLYNVKDPVPARVTQSGGGSPLHHHYPQQVVAVTASVAILLSLLSSSSSSSLFVLVVP